jgi:transcriptional regulator with XRE-family HTH domain
MKSKWYEYKKEAIRLRKKKGFSIRKIEQKLGIPRSTLSGWLKEIKLTPKQIEKLNQNRTNALAKGRKKAIIWHNAKKEKRLRIAESDAKKTLQGIDFTDKSILELTLAILYFGEGFKKNIETGLGSSDVVMMKFFVTLLKNLYWVNAKKMRCELYLRADQNPQRMKRFWSKKIGLPLSCFKQVNVDKRTVGSKTYPHYKGVCSVRCGNVAIQRKLVFLNNMFCEQIIKQYSGT